MVYDRKTSTNEIWLFIITSFTAYWFANSVLWIPWKINQLFGIIVMILLVPILWGGSSLYCLRKIKKENWKISKYLIAILFLLIGVICDFFFFALWRKIPEELYHPTTFAAYALTFIMPIIIGSFEKRLGKDKVQSVSRKSLITIGYLGVIFFVATLYFVRYW
ncbi:MAG: hypothetical protein ACRDA5_10585 [Clostridium sp.]